MGVFTPRKDLVRIIYRAELTSSKLGGSVSDRLDRYVKDLIDLDFRNNKQTIKQLKRISSRLKKGENKYRVYQGILPNDIVSFMKEAEDKGVKSSKIIEEYAPIKQMGDSALMKVKKKMYFPFVIFFIAVFMFDYLIGELAPIIHSGSIPFPESMKSVMEHYKVINFSYGLFFAFLFLVIPQKLPLIKKIFHEINGLLAMATIMILHNLSYASSEMKPILIKSFKLKRKSWKNDGMDGLTKMLFQEGLLTSLQASEIRNSGSVTGELYVVLKFIFEEKRENVKLLDETIQEVVKNFTIFLIAMPLFTMLAILGSLFSGIISLL
ncbi:MAG TPA: hypothetical protein ENN12_04290 [Epsilonproteobacteria bacterium]|nr:hypothetical protein [Campylobacterota bacterium]